MGVVLGEAYILLYFFATPLIFQLCIGPIEKCGHAFALYGVSELQHLQYFICFEYCWQLLIVSYLFTTLDYVFALQQLQTLVTYILTIHIVNIQLL